MEFKQKLPGFSKKLVKIVIHWHKIKVFLNTAILFSCMTIFMKGSTQWIEEENIEQFNFLSAYIHAAKFNCSIFLIICIFRRSISVKSLFIFLAKIKMFNKSNNSDML